MIRADSLPGRFPVQFTNGTQVSVSDTNADKGGGNQGFRPHELLEAALATCMNMTLRMAAEKWGIPLSGASVFVSLQRTDPTTPRFEYRVEFHGDLSPSQREQLLATLERCPVRKTLTQSFSFAQVDSHE